MPNVSNVNLNNNQLIRGWKLTLCVYENNSLHTFSNVNSTNK